MIVAIPCPSMRSKQTGKSLNPSWSNKVEQFPLVFDGRSARVKSRLLAAFDWRFFLAWLCDSAHVFIAYCSTALNAAHLALLRNDVLPWRDAARSSRFPEQPMVCEPGRTLGIFVLGCVYGDSAPFCAYSPPHE